MSLVRTIVVGAGHLGTYHLEKVTADDQAELVGVVDIDPDARAKAAERFDVPAVATMADLNVDADAAIIAAPTRMHLELGKRALERGLHILVEKPITTTVADARQLVAHAERAGLVLQVGHSERFNPAVAAALEVADRPRYIVSERLGPFTGRSPDIDVILDLMIHDLDIIASIVDAPLTEIRAVGVPVLTPEIDMAAVRLEFGLGTVAQLSAGRASIEPSRKMRLFTVERYVSIDMESHEVKSVRRLPPEPGSSWPQIAGEPIEVPQGDPLSRQDADFFRCIRESAAPVVGGHDGIRALDMAVAIREALRIPEVGEQSP